MRVRCGACRTEFDVAGAGRYACPVCGSVNVVRDAGNGSATPRESMGGYQTAPGVGGAGAPPPPPPPPPEEPLPHVECPDCSHSFIVGKIAVATCPNCGAEVATGVVVEQNDT